MPKRFSSEDSKNVGRPGFKGFVQKVNNTSKAGIRRVRQIDPARGITQPGADVITDTHIDIVGSKAKGSPVGRTSPTAFSKDRKTIKAPGQNLRKR